MDKSWSYLSGSASSDRSLEVVDNTNRPMGLRRVTTTAK